ncbi:MAG: stage IV sporulation protein A, partial [Lachnospirales bacterium]
GVVGPVRTGKSTFIKKFMEEMVIPNIHEVHSKERARDELPQSGSGKQIMTTEPKFVPSNAVSIGINENINMNVRLIDCVGYVVDSAIGMLEDEGTPRLINTPWSDKKIPFTEAAEIGTKKVIMEHSTVGVVVTTDGSACGIHRDDYVEAERRVVTELTNMGKPFVVILNSTAPFSEETVTLQKELEKEYGVSVVPMNIEQTRSLDIHNILEKILYEFPVKKITFNFPRWIETLSNDHWLKARILEDIREMVLDVNKLVEIQGKVENVKDNEVIKKAYVETTSLGEGLVKVYIDVNGDLFYKVLSEMSGMDISSEYELFGKIKVLAGTKKDFDKVSNALDQVNAKGYGVVSPLLSEMQLSTPEIVKHGNKYGVKIKASAPSLHFIRADIETEISPIVGTEQQSLDLIDYIKTEMEKDDGKIWDLNMFGKSMQELVREGLQTKLHRMPEDTQMKMQEGLQKMVNENSNGMICIML